MNVSKTWRSGAVVISLAIAGCTVGPDYAAPNEQFDDAWGVELTRGLEATAQPDLATWWQAFGDPTLSELVGFAMQQNLDLSAAASRVREARFERGIVAGDYGPAIDASGFYERSKRSQNSFQGFISGEQDIWSVGFDATWEIDVFGRVRRGVEAADAEIGVAIEDYRDVLVSLVAEVARNYVELRSVQQRLRIAIDNARAQRDTLGLTVSRFDAGLTSELDVAQARVNVSTTESQIPPLRTSIVRTTGRLAVLLGVRPTELPRQITELELDEDDPDAVDVPVAPGHIAVGLPAELLRRRPDVRRAERQLAAASARIGIANADLYPQFSLTGSIGLEADEASRVFDSDSERFAIGPGFRWNLLAWGRLESAVHAAEERHLQAFDAYRQTVLLGLEETRNALTSFMREQERVTALRDGEAAARSAVALAQSLYVQGISDFQNVLDAQRSLFALQDQLAISESTVTTDLIAIFKALGGGWELVAPE